MSDNNKNKVDLKVESMSVEECEKALLELEAELDAYSLEKEKSDDEPQLSTSSVFEPEEKDFKQLDGEKAPDEGNAVFAFPAGRPIVSQRLIGHRVFRRSVLHGDTAIDQRGIAVIGCQLTPGIGSE